MDLQQFDTKTRSNEGVAMELRDIDGEICRTEAGDPVTITLLGVDSDKYQRAEAKVADARLKDSMRSGGRSGLKTSDLNESRIHLLALCTLAWHGITEGGEPLPCSEQNVKRVYEDFPLIRNQVNAFINDRSNYLGN